MNRQNNQLEMSHHVVDRVVAETIAVVIIAIIETTAMMIARGPQ